MTWKELITNTIVTRNAKQAENIACKLRFGLRMNYSESVEFLKRHCPQGVEPEDLFMLADEACSLGR